MSICEDRVLEFQHRLTLRYIEKIYCASWTNGEECGCLQCKYLERSYRHDSLVSREKWTGKEDNQFGGSK